MMFRYSQGAALAASLAALAACGEDEPRIEDQPLEPAAGIEAAGEDTAPMRPHDAPAYYGVWAGEAEWCDIAPGSADPSPIAFTAEEMIGYENRCRIGHVEEGTEGGYQLELICFGEGVEYTEIAEVDVDGVMLRMRRNGGEEVVFVRCEG